MSRPSHDGRIPLIRDAAPNTSVHRCVSDQWPALWKIYGKPGGPRRNGKMCEGDRTDWDLPSEPRIEKLIAWPGNVGTANCRGHARRVGARVIEIAEIEAWHLRALGNR